MTQTPKEKMSRILMASPDDESRDADPKASAWVTLLRRAGDEEGYRSSLSKAINAPKGE